MPDLRIDRGWLHGGVSGGDNIVALARQDSLGQKAAAGFALPVRTFLRWCSKSATISAFKWRGSGLVLDGDSRQEPTVELSDGLLPRPRLHK